MGSPPGSTWWAPPRRRLSRALRDFVEDLGLVGAVQLVGPVSAEIAAAYFAAADVYVTASVADTEGTRRAVRARVPVVNLDGSDTAAGVVLTVAQPSLVAATIARLLTDTAFAAAARNRASRGAQLRSGHRMKVAFVTPRYGPEVMGGAETAARQLAEHLVADCGRRSRSSAPVPSTTSPGRMSSSPATAS